MKKNINNMSEIDIINKIEQDPYFIEHIKNPTKEMKLLAVSVSGFSIQYIKDQDTDIQIEALKNHHLSFQYIKNPTLECCKLAISLDPDNIQWINNPSEELQLLAISKNIDSIDYIQKPTIKVVSLVIKNDPDLYHVYKNKYKKSKEILENSYIQGLINTTLRSSLWNHKNLYYFIDQTLLKLEFFSSLHLLHKFFIGNESIKKLITSHKKWKDDANLILEVIND